MGSKQSTPTVSHYHNDYEEEEEEKYEPAAVRGRGGGGNHYEQKTLRDFLTDMLRDPKLSESDKNIIREARSIVTREASYFRTDYHLTVSLSRTEHRFWCGDRSTQLFVQRNGHNIIEAVYNGKTIRMHLRDGARAVASRMYSFFTNFVAPIARRALPALAFF